MFITSIAVAFVVFSLLGWNDSLQPWRWRNRFVNNDGILWQKTRISTQRRLHLTPGQSWRSEIVHELVLSTADSFW